MQMVVLASEWQKEEWAVESSEEITWISNEHEFLRFPDAGAFVDLLFEPNAKRIDLLAKLLPGLVVVNSVTNTLSETNAAFVRINGWNTFLSSPLTEAACCDENTKRAAETAFAQLKKKPEWLPDEPGFVSARVVSLIINEAYLALAEGVSTKEEINTAMKLGTAYPYGPFEWAEKIGLEKIAALLQKLGEKEARYRPADWLIGEVPE